MTQRQTKMTSKFNKSRLIRSQMARYRLTKKSPSFKVESYQIGFYEDEGSGMLKCFKHAALPAAREGEWKRTVNKINKHKEKALPVKLSVSNCLHQPICGSFPVQLSVFP